MDVFTSLELKKLLNDAETRSEALLKFIRAGEKFDSNKKQNHDIVKSYISSSADCAELLLCLKGEVTPNNLSAIFRCLISILTRTASDLQEFYGKVGMSICDAILRSHLQKIYHALGLHQSPRTVSHGFKVLTLMVMQGREAARDIAHQIDFNLRCFKDVLKRFKGKMSFDIRKSYIHFAVSFFMSGDVRTINRIFDVKGFVSVIFQGMDRDPASTIQVVLTAILNNGVKNLSVSKSSKARFFAESKLLKNIARLYQWDGVFDITGVKAAKKSSGKHFVHHLVRDFLNHVCCPFDYGINFMDKELGIGEKCKNHVLLDFILHLSSLASDPLVLDLIVNILKACPDLLYRFMRDFRMTLEPKNEEIWLRNCELVRCVYEIQPDVAIGLSQMLRGGKRQSEKSSGTTDLDSLVKMILPGVVSPNYSCLPILKHCMKSKSLQIKEKSLNLLLIFMRKLDASITFMSDKSTWQNTGRTTEEADIFYAKFEDVILGNYINIPFLVQLWKELSSGSHTSIKITLLKIMKYCQKLFPADVQDVKFDFTRLMNNIAASSHLSEKSGTLDLMIIDMLSESPQMYKWFKIFDKDNTAFKILLNVIQNSPISGDLHKKSVSLCEKVMLSSGVFQPHETCEASIWVENIVPDVRNQNDQIMIRYLNDVCSKVARMPMKYFDILSGVLEGASITSDSKSNFWETLPTVDIELASEDDWASVVMQRSKVTSDALPVGSNESHGAMSLLAVAALDSLQEVSFMDEERKVLDEYLTRVYFQLLNQTRNVTDGEYFALVWKKAISEITKASEEYPGLDNFGAFLTIWTKKHTESVFSTADESTSAQLQLWVWKIHIKEKPQKTVSAIMSSLFDKSDYDANAFLSLMAQCLLYFDTLCVADNLEPSKELVIAITGLLQEMTKRAGLSSISDTPRSMVEVVSAQEWIFQNPSILGSFFKDIYLQSPQVDMITDSNLTELENTDIDSLCTYAIVRLILKNKLCHSSQINRAYIEKIVQSIPELLKKLPSGMNSCDMKTIFLPEVFYQIQDLGLLTPHDGMSVLSNVTEILQTIESKKVAKLAAKILSATIEKICIGSIDFHEETDIHKATCLIFEFLDSKMLRKPANLISALSMLVHKFPSLGVNADAVLVETVMKKFGSDGVKLCQQIIRYNPLLTETIMKNECFYDLLQQDRLMVIPLVDEALSTLMQDFESNSLEIRKLFDIYWGVFVSTDLWEGLNAILKSCDGERFLHNLLRLSSKFGMKDDVQNLLDDLIDGEQLGPKADDVVVVISCIFSSLGKPSGISRISISSILIIMKMVADYTPNETSTFGLLQRIIDSMPPSLREDLAAKCCLKWSKFVTQVWKKYFESPIAIQCITEFIKLLYPRVGDICDPGIDVGTLRGMLVSHSKFLSSIVMDKAPDHDSLKCSILELHYELATRCSMTDLSPSDLCYLLSTYTATLSKLDQIILKTLLVYEQKGVSVDDMKPFLWGKSAISSYRARKNLGENLWKKPGSTEVLSCIDDSVMDLTLKHFPVRRRMVFIENNMADSSYFENESTGTISAAKNTILKESMPSQNVYDPSFLLPSFIQVLSPEKLVDCKIFVRSGALSYVMCCLASHCHVVRALAANCLIMYYHHAQTAWFSENNLTMYVIRCVRNSIPMKNDSHGNTVIAKLPSVVANFLAAIVQLHLNPKDHMFSVLHRYLLIKPQLDLKDIPEFYVLFFSAEMESKIERTWVVNLICNGLRDQGDFHTINKRNVVQLLMCLHDSAVADNFVRRQVFEVFERLASILSSAIDLVKKKGFVSWLKLVASNQPTRDNIYSRATQTTGRPGQRRDDTKDIIRVVSTLCKTLHPGSIIVKQEDELLAQTENEVAISSASSPVEKMEVEDESEKNAIVTRNQSLITATDGSTALEKMEVVQDDAPQKKKRIAVTPYHILKQIVTLMVTLQQNLLQTNDFDFDFCEECLQVLSSCISQMNERNTKIAPKQSNLVFLNDGDIEIIYQTALKVLKSSCDEHRKENAISSVLTIFMACKPDSSLGMSGIWESIFHFVVTDSKSLWTTSSTWIEAYLLQLCHWLKTCMSLMGYKPDLTERKALSMLYAVIFKYSEALQSNYIKCLQILNEIHLGEIYESDVTLAAILKDTNKIQRKIYKSKKWIC